MVDWRFFFHITIMEIHCLQFQISITLLVLEYFIEVINTVLLLLLLGFCFIFIIIISFYFERQAPLNTKVPLSMVKQEKATQRALTNRFIETEW